MYYLVGHGPEMGGLVELHPKGRFYARLEGIAQTVFSDRADWNPCLIYHQSPSSALQIMTQVQHSWTEENWCIARPFKPDLTGDSNCWRWLKGILGTRLSDHIDQLEPLDLEPLLGSYCQVTVKHRKLSPHQIMMELVDFSPVLATPWVESLFPLFEPRIWPDDEAIDEARKLIDQARALVDIEPSEILTV